MFFKCNWISGEATRRSCSEAGTHDRAQRQVVRHGSAVFENAVLEDQERALLYVESGTLDGST